MNSQWILSLPRNVKRMIVLSIDVILLPLALWISFSLRLGEFYVPQGSIVYLFVAGPVIAVPIFIRLGLYRAIIRYLGFVAMWTIIKAVSLYTLAWGVFVLLTATPGVPRSVLLINWLMAILLVGGTRAMARWWLSGAFRSGRKSVHKKKVTIYGAGAAGIQIANALSNSNRFKPVAFIDDNPGLQGNTIGGLRVYPFSELGLVIENLGVSEVLLGLYAAAGMTYGLWAGRPLALPFLALIGVGFLATGARTLVPERSVEAPTPTPEPVR